MCETPKDKNESVEDTKDKTEERSYYYDDAHGYEDYDPDGDDEEDTLDDDLA